jgi:single-stranded DNA-specific DHH superfamily exonuclease
MKSSVKKVKEVAKEALVEVAELKKADAAVASAGVDRLAAARAAAALKRQKKAAASDARAKGKIAAAEAREKKAEDFEEDRRKDREEILAKIARTRKAMGIRKNEDNPAALRRLIEQWETESNVRLYNKYRT